jgi:flagellar FliJ protein
MNRVTRLQPVARVAETREQGVLRELADCGRRIADARERLTQLVSWQREYASKGASATIAPRIAREAGDTQQFLARLAAAIAEQEQRVAALQVEREGIRTRWQITRAHSQAMDHLIGSLRDHEGREQSRREQRDADEGSLRRHQRPVD